MNKPVYILGDVHGKWEELFSRINAAELSGCYLICVGDLGVGFKDSNTKEIRCLEIANEFFAKRDIQFLSIRGNHDNPVFFNTNIQEFSNLRLVPDYHIEYINEEKFLFVGGAISIDRRLRKANVSYWVDEPLVFRPGFVVKCDVLITHSAPTWLGPFDKDGIIGWCDNDEYLWRDCTKERDDIVKIVELSRPSRLYCGHFHEYHTAENTGCRAFIIEELGFKEHH